jgi:hypothetical protein
LLNDVLNQPTQEQLDADPLLCRFRMVFDRAGCSPAFIIKMWRDHRIAILTYRKNPGPDWPESEFGTHSVKLANGETVEMELAERRVWIEAKEDKLEVREIRRLKRGKHQSHQTAILSADPRGTTDGDAAARWSQENFFRYMLQDFGLDLLADYQREKFPCAIPVPNPARKKLDAECRSARGKLAAAKIKLVNHTLTDADIDKGSIKAWADTKESLLADVKKLEGDIVRLSAERKPLPTHIPFDELPAEQRFERLAPSRKLLMDTIRMIAYRAETAMAAIVAPAMAKPTEARAVLKALFETPADLLPDAKNNVLRVRLHPLAEVRMNRAIEPLIEQLNAAEYTYPGTTLQVKYELLGPSNPPAISQMESTSE